MTRAHFGPGTIRMAMLALIFISLTVALIVLQPGPDRDFAAYGDHDEVSMTDTGALGADTPQATAPPEPSAAPSPPPRPATQVISDLQAATARATRATADVAPSPMAPPTELRQMSWGILQQLDDATGRDTAPGDPGSLLHTIVTRAMTDGLSDTGSPEIVTRLPRAAIHATDHDTYLVQPDDTLLKIAQDAYGDPTAFDRIFQANRDRLSSPEDLRAGQMLRLPRP